MKSRSSCCQLDSWFYLVQARAAIAVTIEQRRQMLGAGEYAMAVPRPAGSVEVEINGPCGGRWPSIRDIVSVPAGLCWSVDGGCGHDNLPVRRLVCGHGRLSQDEPSEGATAVTAVTSITVRGASAATPVSIFGSFEAMLRGRAARRALDRTGKSATNA